MMTLSRFHSGLVPGQRLFLEDIQGGAGDHPGRQGRDQRFFVDDGASRYIDQYSRIFHRDEYFIVNQVLRCFGMRRRDHQEITILGH